MFWGAMGVLLSNIDDAEAKEGWDMILTVSMEVSISFYLLIFYMDNWLIEPLQLIAGRREKLFWKAKLPGKAVRSPLENSRVGRSRLLYILSVKHILLCEADGKY